MIHSASLIRWCSSHHGCIPNHPNLVAWNNSHFIMLVISAGQEFRAQPGWLVSAPQRLCHPLRDSRTRSNLNSREQNHPTFSSFTCWLPAMTGFVGQNTYTCVAWPSHSTAAGFQGWVSQEETSKDQAKSQPRSCKASSDLTLEVTQRHFHHIPLFTSGSELRPARLRVGRMRLHLLI